MEFKPLCRCARTCHNTIFQLHKPGNLVLCHSSKGDSNKDKLHALAMCTVLMNPKDSLQKHHLAGTTPSQIQLWQNT